MLTPARQRAGITAALYLAFYTGAGLPAIVVGAIAIGTSLIDAILIFTLVLLLAVIVFIPVPSLALTTVRRSRAEAAAALEADRHAGHIPGVAAPQGEPAAHLTEEPSAPFSFVEDYHSN